MVVVTGGVCCCDQHVLASDHASSWCCLHPKLLPSKQAARQRDGHRHTEKAHCFADLGLMEMTWQDVNLCETLVHSRHFPAVKCRWKLTQQRAEFDSTCCPVDNAQVSVSVSLNMVCTRPCLPGHICCWLAVRTGYKVRKRGNKSVIRGLNWFRKLL